MDVLVCLARRGGEVVSRDELVAAVWGEDAFVSENTVSQSISRLRKALDDDWREPRFIETISRTGYRLKVPVTDDDTVVSEASVPAAGVRVDPRPALTSIGNERSAKISPDGSKIAYAWAAEGDNFEIYIQETESGNRVRLTENPGHDDFPAWSPDGGSIAFARGSQDGCGLYRKSILGGPEERLGDMPADGGEAVQVTDHGGFRALEGPEGRYLYYSKREEPGVWRRPIEGGGETRLVDSSHPFDWATWEVGKAGIYFVVRWPTFICLYRFVSTHGATHFGHCTASATAPLGHRTASVTSPKAQPEG